MLAPVCAWDSATNLDHHAQRRSRLLARLGPAALVLYGGELRARSNDTHFRFRPDTDFYYLTGLAEPGAVLVLRGGDEPNFALFVRPRDAEAEVWAGRRVGPEGAKAMYGAQGAWPLAELDKELPGLLDGVPEVHWPLGRWPRLDRTLTGVLEKLRGRNRFGASCPQAFRDARQVLGEDRMHKDPAALAALRRAIDITASAHRAAMAATQPGGFEYGLEAVMEYEFRRRGAAGPGYGTIVGAGDNATILHYVDNQGPLAAGDLVLVDGGAEVDLFSADITRTWPVSGRFSPAQGALYDLVLAANEAGIAAVTVGSNVDAIHHRCLEVLCAGLIDLGLLEGSPAQAIEEGTYKRFYMHRSSHWLGADVHDAGDYTQDRTPRGLQPGFVLTVEPGLYIAKTEETVPPEFRGVGIRIEDDVLVTADGPEVLSWRVPKAREEVEALVGTRASPHVPG